MTAVPTPATIHSDVLDGRMGTPVLQNVQGIIQSLIFTNTYHVPGAVLDNGSNLPYLLRMSGETWKSNYNHHQRGLTAFQSVARAICYIHLKIQNDGFIL